MTKKIAIIGGGFSGLSSATYLAKEGFEVTIFEKNSTVGGRNRKFSAEGFTFEMGPSWYWMPQVFDAYFNDFQKERKNYYSLTKLNPSFSIVFKEFEKLDIPSEEKDLIAFFENIEKGAGERFQAFMLDAKYKYDSSMTNLILKPGKSLFEFFEWEVIKGVFKLHLFSNFKKFVRKYFKDERLTNLMDFPVLFLGSAPENTPALYSLMNYAGLLLGTWYPEKGMYRIIESMEELAVELGVKIHTNHEVSSVLLTDNNVSGLVINGETHEFDAVIASGDYKHMETLLPPSFRNYTDDYWSTRTLAPSSLIFFLGFDKKIHSIEHHTLFFDESLEKHTEQIYFDPKWPEKPLFYVCAPSKTDPSVAPENCENIFILIPIAAGLEDTDEIREKYFNIIIDRLEKQVEEPIKEHIIYKKSYCINDFKADYHSYKGNAYGLANTLRQTAILKPKLNNKKLKNLIYAGQLTVPGPGVPPSLISGKLAANELITYFKK
jgi:phytoene desaturase